MATSTRLSIKYVPSDMLPSSSGVGICFSGGGSRSLVAAMGQLRALKDLDLLDKVSMISAVSGGAWAAALFTYLPASIPDDDFLGPVVAPGDITLQSLARLPKKNLGSVPQRLSMDKLVKAAVECLGAGYKLHDVWQGIVGKCIFKPFGLWDVDANGYPKKYYASSPADAEAIVARNQGLLKVSDFYVAQPRRVPRPQLLMGGAMFSDQKIENSQVLPFQSAPVGIGIAPFFKGMGVHGRDIGGGLIENVGMGSKLVAALPANTAHVTIPRRPFSLSDMAAISSAAFAHVLQAQIPHLMYKLGETITPTHEYWPVGSMSTKPRHYLFGDGGLLENTGIPTLLSHGIRNIVAFVNQQTPVQKAIESQISGLFGQPSGPSEAYALQLADTKFGQVFRHEDLSPLVTGLRAAQQQGPAMFLQTLQTVENDNFGVPGCQQIRVLWVCNAWVDAWYEGLDADVRHVVTHQRKLFEFPYYDTIRQLELSPTQVNLLAHLSCWGLQTKAQLVRSVFEG